MSPSRGSKGESQWSSCSVDSLFKADLSCLDENSGAGSESLDLDAGVYPGEIWTANRQCQIFLLDQNAFMDHTTETYDKMCYSLKCRTPKREGKFNIDTSFYVNTHLLYNLKIYLSNKIYIYIPL